MTENYNWYHAKSEANSIGYRLPTGNELKEILMKTPLSHPLWNSLEEQGYSKGVSGGPWFWTSIGNNETWSDWANENEALAIRFGSKNNSIYEQEVHDGEEILSDRVSNYGNIIAVKKLK